MSVSRKPKVAFIGTGIMGAPIAGHILDAGYDLTVHNRTKSKADGLVAKGAHWADTPADAAKDADVVFTMLGYPSDVEDVYLTTNGLLRATKKGAYLIDLTTSSSQLAHDIYEAAEIDDKHAFDCPVTGGEDGAIAGTLTLIAGTDEKTAAPVLPILQTFSSKIYYMGGAGKGQTTKLCNQVSLAACMIGYADAIALAEQSDVDVSQMLDVVSHGMGGSVALERLAPKSVAGDYKPGFLSEHLRKDIGLALSQAEDRGITLPGAETAFTLYDMLCQIGGKRMGTQAITLLYQEEATAAAAGLDWSLLDAESIVKGDEDDDGKSNHKDGCECGHDHGNGECCHHHDHKGDVASNN
ncbi:MAG: NAD(P)-dependent oxidoreductase [Tractidigestivibacter sp.]|jgi:3-hydroxyisobutyrate dehydrogenase|uniref:NAD(P)-dependent oxidoreductase n=1 Tax=Tractidigestivibacter sp. TaxID=2847320 RepID=UPI003D8F698A